MHEWPSVDDASQTNSPSRSWHAIGPSSRRPSDYALVFCFSLRVAGIQLVYLYGQLSMF